MAKPTYYNVPYDLPLEIEPGVTHREADFFAQASTTRGFGVQLRGETPIGAAKGNRTMASWPSHRAPPGGPPWGTLKGGR